jgi:hypothetical protein
MLQQLELEAEPDRAVEAEIARRNLDHRSAPDIRSDEIVGAGDAIAADWGFRALRHDFSVLQRG